MANQFVGVSKAELLEALSSAGGGKDPSFWEDVAPLEARSKI